MTGESWHRLSRQEPLIGLHILTVLSKDPVARKLLCDHEQEITSAVCSLKILRAGRKKGVVSLFVVDCGLGKSSDNLLGVKGCTTAEDGAAPCCGVEC